MCEVPILFNYSTILNNCCKKFFLPLQSMYIILRVMYLWVHAHALNFRVDLKGPVAALDGMKSEANGVSRTCTECSWFISKGLSLLWTEWRARLMGYHAHALNARGWPWKGRRCTGRNEERCGLYRAVSGPVRPGGRDADVLVVSWLVGWLKVVASRCGRFSFVRRLSSAAGSLNLALRSRVSYTLPASRTRPNAARRCYSPRWLARRQDCRRLALW
jgi:hypothetical protein